MSLSSQRSHSENNCQRALPYSKYIMRGKLLSRKKRNKSYKTASTKSSWVCFGWWWISEENSHKKQSRTFKSFQYQSSCWPFYVIPVDDCYGETKMLKKVLLLLKLWSFEFHNSKTPQFFEDALRMERKITRWEI